MHNTHTHTQWTCETSAGTHTHTHTYSAHRPTHGGHGDTRQGWKRANTHITCTSSWCVHWCILWIYDVVNTRLYVSTHHLWRWFTRVQDTYPCMSQLQNALLMHVVQITCSCSSLSACVGRHVCVHAGARGHSGVAQDHWWEQWRESECVMCSAQVVDIKWYGYTCHKCKYLQSMQVCCA